MFWELTIAETARRGFLGKLLDKIWLPKPQVSMQTAYGTAYKRLTLTARVSGKIDWEEILDYTGQGAQLLLPQGLEIPEEIPLRETDTAEYRFKLLENLALEVLKQDDIPAARKTVGLIDSDGDCLNFAHALIKKVAMLKVLTGETEKYERLAEQMLESYGTPVLVVSDEVAFDDCIFVVSARVDSEDRYAAKEIACPVLAVAPQHFGHRTQVIEKFTVETVPPEGEPQPLQAGMLNYLAALYTHNKVRELGDKLPTAAHCKQNKLALADILTYFIDKA